VAGCNERDKWMFYSTLLPLLLLLLVLSIRCSNQRCCRCYCCWHKPSPNGWMQLTAVDYHWLSTAAVLKLSRPNTAVCCRRLVHCS